MARGNAIVVEANPRGKRVEGYIASGLSPKPGQIMERDPTVALRGGRATYKLYTPGTDGGKPKGALWVLEENNLLGRTTADAYAAGDHCFLYCPLPGEEVNILLLDIVGTTDDHPAGEIVIPQSGTGKFIVTAGTPSVTFQLLETVTDPVADTLAWCEYGGY